MSSAASKGKGVKRKAHEEDAKLDTAEQPPKRSKVSAKVEAKGDTDAEVVKQFEFYFSLSNLPFDKHLQQRVKLGKGWVEVSHIASFKKIQGMCTDVEHIRRLLKTSELLEISSDGEKVKRKSPLPADAVQIVHKRSIRVKNLPDACSIDGVRSFFAEHGTVLSVRLIHGKVKVQKGEPMPPRPFLGKAFIEFKSEDEMKTVLAKTLKFGNNDLVMESRPAYHARKKAEFLERKSKAKTTTAAAASAATEEKKEEKKKPREFKKGKIMRVKPLAADADYGKLKNAFKEAGIAAAYIDQTDQGFAFVRLHDSDEPLFKDKPVVTSEQAAAAINSGDVKYEDIKLSAEPLTHEEEVAYWEDVDKKRAIANQNRNSGRKYKRRKGGRH